jgi:predicted aconitase with swiveling domain
MEIRLKGRYAVGDKAEGEALTCREPITFWSVDQETGRFCQPGHELYDKSINNKVLVYSCGCGAVGYFLWLLKIAGNEPKALVMMQPYSQEVIDAISANIPVVYGFDQNILLTIENGDYVFVNEPAKGEITINKGNWH